MFIKLDETAINLLCCAFCKGQINSSVDYFYCGNCGMKFPRLKIETAPHTAEYCFDFRINHPNFCLPATQKSWRRTQKKYQHYHECLRERDSLPKYLAEIDSVREIYENEFHLHGCILDVGGHQGKLRHFLTQDIVLYISVDPFPQVFYHISRQSNLIRAYPCLQQPCNFVAAAAEHLPFKAGTFDWIHMRSVLDHFADPYLALHEAFRCTKPNGKLLIGLAIAGGNPKSKKNHIATTWLNFKRRLKTFCQLDDHLFRFCFDDMIRLLELTGWHVEKIHWQKPPFQHCAYISSTKKSLC